MPTIKDEQWHAENRRALSKRRQDSKLVSQHIVGYRERRWADDYADVRIACERKLREWERVGIIAPRAFGGNDWIFANV